MRLFTLIVIVGLGIMLGVGIYAGQAFMSESQRPKQVVQVSRDMVIERHADHQVMHRLRGALPSGQVNPKFGTPLNTVHPDTGSHPQNTNTMPSYGAAYAHPVVPQVTHYAPYSSPQAVPQMQQMQQVAPAQHLSALPMQAPQAASTYRVPVNSADGVRVLTVVNR